MSTVLTYNCQDLIGTDTSPLSNICRVVVMAVSLAAPFHSFISALMSDESRPNFTVASITESANQIGTVMLVPADTSVGWFKEAIQTASEVRFITAGRLAFINPVSGKPVSGNNKGSMLIIWRPYPRTHCHFATVGRDELMAFGAKLLARREAA